MSEGIIFSGNGVCVADSKGRFALPLEMRKTAAAVSVVENLVIVSFLSKGRGQAASHCGAIATPWPST